MGLLDDIVKTLDRIPGWKRIQELPSEVDQLAKRVAELEEKLGGKWPPDVCRFCGERAVRMTAVRGPSTKGNMEQTWVCAQMQRPRYSTHSAVAVLAFCGFLSKALGRPLSRLPELHFGVRLVRRG